MLYRAGQGRQHFQGPRADGEESPRIPEACACTCVPGSAPPGPEHGPRARPADPVEGTGTGSHRNCAVSLLSPCPASTPHRTEGLRPRACARVRGPTRRPTRRRVSPVPASHLLSPHRAGNGDAGSEVSPTVALAVGAQRMLAAVLLVFYVVCGEVFHVGLGFRPYPTDRTDPWGADTAPGSGVLGAAPRPEPPLTAGKSGTRNLGPLQVKTPGGLGRVRGGGSGRGGSCGDPQKWVCVCYALRHSQLGESCSEGARRSNRPDWTAATGRVRGPRGSCCPRPAPLRLAATPHLGV